MTNDILLLTHYARRGSEAAFAEIAARYRAMVFRICRRELDSDTLAEDAAQIVFLLLARKAKTLTLHSGPSLAGWLFRTAVFVAKDVRKQEARRQRRDQIVMSDLAQTYPTPPPEDDPLAPLLNPALASLKSADRDAVLLRCFQGLTLAETGAALSVTEDAAQMRVARALDKLRRYLSAHGAVVSVAAFLAAEAARPVPARAAEAVLSPNALLLSKGVSYTMKVLNLKVAALAAAVLLGGADLPPLVRAISPHKSGIQTVAAPSLLAETSTPTPGTQTASTAQTMGTQTIQLQHTVPGQMIKLLHWNQAAKLPAGVTKVEAVPAQNALTVTATPAGINRVQEILKLLDIEPRKVLIQTAFADVTEADLQTSGVSFELVPLDKPKVGSVPVLVRYARGEPAVQLLQKLTKRSLINQAPEVLTTNNIIASINSTTKLPSGQIQFAETSLTPRINSDNSITLALHFVRSVSLSKREISTLRTIQNGDTMIAIMPPTASQIAGDNLLLFLTPTVK